MRKSRLRSPHHRSIQSGVCGFLAILLLLPTIPIHASSVAQHEQVGKDTFLGGQYMELGIAGSGTLGTSSSSPGGFHPGQLRQSIGLNTNRSGYSTGTEMTSGDYVLPGSPSEGFMIGYKPSTDSAPQLFLNEEQNGNVEIPGTTEDISNSDQLGTLTTGETLDKALGVQQTISFKPEDSFYKTTVQLTNTSVTDSVYDVHYMRFIDPDMDADLNNNNSTINWVPSNPPGDADAIGIAMGSVSDNIFMYVASDPRAQASIGFSRNPYMEPAFRENGGIHQNARLSDEWLSLTFNAGDLLPGESTELVFYSSVDPDMNRALTAIHADYQRASEETPTDILLSNDPLTWDAVPGSLAGQLSAVSENPEDTFIYSLVSGEGSDSNSYFVIRDNRLETASSLVRGVNDYPVRIRATGPEGGVLEKNFVIHASAPEQTAELTSLSIENGSLYPYFKPEVTSYTASMNAEADTITVVASVYDPDSVLSINGATVTDEVYGTGSLRYSAPLSNDLTDLKLKVTAPSGSFKNYNIQVVPASMHEPVVIEAPVNEPETNLPAEERPAAEAPVQAVPGHTIPEPGSVPATPVSDTYIPAAPPLTITFPFLPQLPIDNTTSIPIIIGGGGGGASRLDDLVANPQDAAARSAVSAPGTNQTSNSAKKTAASKQTTGSGYVQGYEDGTFRPDQKVTRAELSVMLERLLGNHADGSKAVNFNDVSTSYWAAAGIQLMSSNGWMKGYPDGSFQPAQAMTRAELASLIARWQDLNQMQTGAETNNVQASDLIGNWAAASIQQVMSAGLMQGFPDGKFYPNQPVTRAEVVTVLNRIQHLDEAGTGSSNVVWKDVQPTHWAYAAIRRASQ